MLFEVITTEKEIALLAIPETCGDKTIPFYHSSLFAGYQCLIKAYLPVGDTFFMPGLVHHLRSYIKGYHVCQLSRNEKFPVRQLQKRIDLKYKPLSRLSIHLKVMFKSYKVKSSFYVKVMR